jgi:hypothetical protein
MKTIKEHYSEITIGVLLAIGFTVCVFMLSIHPEEAKAATYPATTISLPTYNSGVLLTNPYFILYDVRTGYLVHATTGVPGVGVIWVGAAFDSDHWTDGAVSGASGFPNLIIPALNSSRTYGIMMFDAASPAKTDTCVNKGLYNPRGNMTYSDSNPTKRGEVMTRTFIE